MLIVSAEVAGDVTRINSSYHSANIEGQGETAAMLTSANISGGDAVLVVIDLVSEVLR